MRFFLQIVQPYCVAFFKTASQSASQNKNEHWKGVKKYIKEMQRRNKKEAKENCEKWRKYNYIFKIKKGLKTS